MSENEAQKLRTEFQGLEKRLDVFEARINERLEQSEKQRDYRFDQIEKQLKEMQSDLTSQLKKIDADIRGNGKVGINVQLDRLENSKKAAKKWFWIVVAAIAPVLIANYFSWLSKAFN